MAINRKILRVNIIANVNIVASHCSPSVSDIIYSEARFLLWVGHQNHQHADAGHYKKQREKQRLKYNISLCLF